MASQSPQIFDYLPQPWYVDLKRNCIDIPFSVPRHKRSAKMAHSDYIANTLAEDIKEYRIRSFDNFAVDVKVYPVPSAKEFYDKKDRWIGFSDYYFEALNAKLKVMSVTVDSEWNVKIRYLGAWQPVSAYLENLQPYNAWDESTPKNDAMHLRWRQQADWWNENRKVFEFMNLPREIRDIVYEHVWGTAIEPYPTNSSRKLTKLGKMQKKLRNPNINIMKTSAQVWAEASDILHVRTPFYIEHYGVLRAFTSNITQRNQIRRLILAFSHDEFMNLFSTEHVRMDKKAGTLEIGFGFPALALRVMTLNSLTLTIAAPSLTTKTGKFDGACQRVAVDTIMDAAWPVIRGHPLELNGFIKISQKKIYEARDVLERKRILAWRKKRATWGLADGSLEEYGEELDEEVGGVSLSGARPEVASGEYPAPVHDLRCRCDPPCTEETWTPWE